MEGRRAGHGRWSLLAGATVLVLLLVGSGGAFGASVTSATFTGGAGTVSVGGTLYAKNGGALTLTVNTSSDTQCVQITGAHISQQGQTTGKSTWTFSFTAGGGNGLQTITATAFKNFNPNNQNCSSQPGTGTASYVLDNTGPTVTGSLSPAPNPAGWNNSNTTVTWSASDSGSGVASLTPASDTQTADTAGTTKSATATDRLGNSGSGSVTIKLDKSSPAISGSASPGPNANGWNNTSVTVSFTCTDPLSGIKSCSGPTTRTAESASADVTGTAVDNADNSAQATVPVKIDKTAPSLSGAPTTSPNGNGWYSGSVSVHWTCADALSGMDGSCPADSTISGEGTGLFDTKTVSDKAGNSATANSSPSVRIDRTAPTTNASAVSAWNNVSQTITLTANDALSGVDATHYTVDGGATQSGTSVSISSEGDHTLEFWSVDRAGNEEAHHVVRVGIDLTPPTIAPVLSPAPNGNGWNKSNVTVHFECADQPDLSGIASCTADQVVTSEGANQEVDGSALDNAGNSASGHAYVSLDKTPPTISGAPDRPPNGNGWYDGDVTVGFTCADGLSGIASCAAPSTLGEGAGQSVAGSALDAAGNSADSTVSGINVDETKPELSGTPTTDPNGNGWYDGDVAIHWDCSDGLSGIDGVCPADDVLTGEGSNLSASESVSDLAGNSRTATVAGIKIDRTAPTTHADLPDPVADGWYAGPVLVTLAASDSLSGVESTHYSVDGGPAQDYSDPFSFDLNGVHTLRFWSLDKAGNREDESAATIKIDTVNPTISAARTPEGNAFGWNNGPVTVSFSCFDDDSGIRVSPPGCPDLQTILSEGAQQSASGTTYDRVGNHASTTLSGIDIDLTAPDLTGAATTAPNAYGWYRDDVAVHWTPSDALSGIDPSTVPADSLVTGEGDDLSAGPVAVSDKAGNSTSASLGGIRIDRTAPTISAAPDRPANAHGWYDGDVTVSFGCGDALSGVGSCPEPVVLGEGADQSASGTAFDKAGNSESAGVEHVNVDETKPELSGAPTTDPNPNGWYKDDVTVHWSCSDALSGIDGACPADETLKGEGPDLSASASVSDLADNSRSASVSGIQIDRTAPSTKAELPDPVADGWYGGPVLVTLGASDALSGVESTHYSIDGGPAQNYSAPFSFDQNGVHTIRYWSGDNAGNVEDENAATVKIDAVDPSISASRSPLANSFGWNNGPVTVSFDCADTDSGIRVAPPGCPGAQALGGEGAGQSATGTAYDRVGNHASTTLSGIDIDLTAPTLSGSTTTVPNAYGWYRGDVTVHWTAGDGLSGIDPATIPADSTVTGEGGNLSAGPVSVADKAGNSSSASVGGIMIDRTAPAISAAPDRPANGNGWYANDVTVSFSCSDALSGIDYCPQPVSVAEGADQSASGTAYDRAGNSASTALAHLNVDRTKPTITASATKADGSAYVPGTWTNQSVTVHFTCSDALSGLDGGCPADATVSGSTAAAGQTVSGSVSDKAGNSDSASLLVKVDKDAPVLTVGAPTTNSTVSADSVAVLGSASDTPSGLQGLTVNGTPTSVALDGTFSATVSLACGANTIAVVGTDFAGNQTTRSASVNRSCLWPGAILQPVATNNGSQGDPRATNLTVIKIKSTIPVKFQVYLNQAMTQLMTTPPAGSTARLSFERYDTTTDSSQPVDTYSAGSANTDNVFRWTASPDNQYVYNLATTGKTAGTYRVQLTLYAADGTTILGRSAWQYLVLRS
ncbi:MAG TPA: hypothetical protein VI142_02965 [Gaiellaceae bacterium]